MRRMMLAGIATIAAGPALAQQQPRPRPPTSVPPGAIIPPDGSAGVTAIVDRRSGINCTIAIGLIQKSGRTREVATAVIEVFTHVGMSEIHNVVWQYADEDNPRWVNVTTGRPCQQSPTIAVRNLRICSPIERRPDCEPPLAPFRIRTERPLPWLEVIYRTDLSTPGALDVSRLPEGAGRIAPPAAREAGPR